MGNRVAVLGVVLSASLWAVEARAQSAPVCWFDAQAGVLSVAILGEPATLQATAGGILLNGAACGTAAPDSTDLIRVYGSSLSDRLTLSGRFAPGRVVEETGSSEVEILLDLDASDAVTFSLTAGDDAIRFGPGGFDEGGDGDIDVFFGNGIVARVLGRPGNDLIDAADYTGPARLSLFGDDGNDVITAPAARRNTLYGGAGADVVEGGGVIRGGPGDDVLVGGPLADTFHEDAGPNGSDSIDGGDGTDTISYALRTAPVTVTLAGGADDGEAGELDDVQGCERASGGAGGDLLVGNALPNRLFGNGGDDELLGGPGNDDLHGNDGDDVLTGEDGNDDLEGGPGSDLLDDGPGRGNLFGGDGNDELHGGSGSDFLSGEDGDDRFFNLDAYSDTVWCGPGIDDPEPDPRDAYQACEL